MDCIVFRKLTEVGRGMDDKCHRSVSLADNSRAQALVSDKCAYLSYLVFEFKTF